MPLPENRSLKVYHPVNRPHSTRTFAIIVFNLSQGLKPECAETVINGDNLPHCIGWNMGMEKTGHDSDLFWL
jgi:hypothetical protein